MLRQLNASSPGDIITLATPPDYVILDVGPVDGTDTGVMTWESILKQADFCCR